MFKKSYHILMNNKIFIQPVLLWVMIFSLLLKFSLSNIQALVPEITMWLAVFLLFCAMLSGWLYINKYALLSYNEKDSPEMVMEKTINNFKKFFEGIGSDFIRTVLTCLVCIFIYIAAFYYTYKFCINNFGFPDILNDFIKISQNSTKQEFIQFMGNIPENTRIVFAKWVVVINTVISVLNFFSILYLTIMTLERKNFLVSFFSSLKFFVINIFESVMIMFFVFLIYVVMNLIPLIFGYNSITFALIIIFLALYLNYYILLVFCLYYEKTNSNNRCECLRKNETGN